MDTSVWRMSNLALAFVLELLALAALGFWGARMGDSPALKILFAVAIPGVAAVLWGLFAAPQATFSVPVLAVATKIVVFGVASAALWQLDHRIAAVAFPALVLANLTVLTVSR